MNFDSLSADPFGRTDLAVKNGISNVAPLTSWHKHRRPAAARAAATLAFAAGLLAAALGAGRTSQRGSNRPPSEPARTASASSRLRSSSLCPISPTSAPATRARGRTLSPAHRSTAGNLVEFLLEFPPSGSAKR
jgi:hypothetical protein